MHNVCIYQMLLADTIIAGGNRDNKSLPCPIAFPHPTPTKQMGMPQFQTIVARVAFHWSQHGN